MNKMLEYNLKLNGEYFLYLDKDKWILVRNKFFNYEVMSSTKNTETELKQFIKKHSTYKYDLVSGFVNVILSIIAVILSIINMKINNVALRTFIYGMLLVLIVQSLVKIIVDNHNQKVLDRIFEEDKEYLKNLKEEKKDVKNKKKKSKGEGNDL